MRNIILIYILLGMQTMTPGQKPTGINMLDSNGIPTGEWQIEFHSRKEINSILKSKAIRDYCPKTLRVQIIFKKNINEGFFLMTNENNNKILEAHGWLVWQYGYYPFGIKEEVNKYGVIQFLKNWLEGPFFYRYIKEYYPNSTQMKSISHSDISPDKNYSESFSCDSIFNEKGKLILLRKNYKQLYIDSVWKFDKWFTTLEIQNDTVQTKITYYPRR